MSQLIGLVPGPGRGFEIAQTVVQMTTSVALARGDVVQCTMDANGEYSTCTGAGAGSASFTAATYTDATLLLTKTGAFASLVPAPRFTPIAITGGSYVHATRTITKVGAFASYTLNTTDRFYCASGTGATVGASHVVATRVSDDAITLASPGLGAGADGVSDIAGTLTSVNNTTRLYITGGTAITVGVVAVVAKISDDAVAISADIGSGASDVAFTILDNQLMRGHFAVAKHDMAANAKGEFYLSGRVYAYTRNSADAAIGRGNLYFPTSAKDLDSGLAAGGLNAKFVAEAIDTAAVSTTATRALRLVNFNGLVDFGGTYAGVA